MKTNAIYLIILCAILSSCGKTENEKTIEEQVLSLKLSTYAVEAY